MNTLPPNTSPIRPNKSLIRRKYEPYLLDEALKLCHSDGVAYAEKATGVKRTTLYKLLKPAKEISRTAKAPKPKAERPEKSFAATGLFRKACALGEYYHANVPGDSKRNAYARASAKLGIDAGLLWKAWKYSNFTNK